MKEDSDVYADAFFSYGRAVGVRFAHVADHGLESLHDDNRHIVLFRDDIGINAIVVYDDDAACGMYARCIAGELVA